MSRIRWFSDLSMDDIGQVGGKNASLGELVQGLVPLGVRVPDGFATTADAYRELLAENGLDAVVRDHLGDLDLDDVTRLQRAGAAVRAAFLEARLPERLASELLEAYDRLVAGGATEVAVRSSATAEDLPDASFAGQQETFLAVSGHDALLDRVRRCFASLFTDRAISYRAERGFDQLAVALSVGVQRMVRSDLGAAGVMFTIDTESGAPDVVLVTGAWGLGESVVQGTVGPDEMVVFKPTLATGKRPILRHTLGAKETRMVYAEGGVRTEDVPLADRRRFVLDDDQVLDLARMGVAIEAHYSARHGTWTPMDIEWALDGRTGELFIVQARPETVRSRESRTSVDRWVEDGHGKVLATGRAVGASIATGTCRLITSTAELHRFQDGEIPVASRTDPDWEPVMRRSAAIVTDHGGRTCHAAIVARELGVPAVVGADGATSTLTDGALVTVSCAHGAEGRVYEGAVPFHVEHTDLGTLERPHTKVMMNVGTPSEALGLARLPCDGVGLARQEFIVSADVGVHPGALLAFDSLDPELRERVEAVTAGWVDKPSFYVDRLAEGVAQIAAAFWPRPVTVRLSDFKTNEYRRLLGGEAYEPHEENPMIGWRGASRYADPAFAAAFALECRALRRVRSDMGLTNVRLMVPFCRTLDEGRKVLDLLASHGLVQGEDGLEVWVMCEIPSNALLAEQFATLFDGLSIGSNDLTQLTLGVDRDNEQLASLFDENDAAVKAMIRVAIEGCHRAGKPIGICGQAPSDHPGFAAWLVEQGIDSLSVTPDVVLAVTERVLALERR
ncbi:MAG: phosphoenolpyruvate synthase [Alphaproteobacteria bacterium]|nr:phosphoenolpyruvate synthase [Alphaproteobacteria bacterium]